MTKKKMDFFPGTSFFKKEKLARSWSNGND